MKQAWNIVDLNRAMQADLMKCHTLNERINCKAICLKEMRELMSAKKAQGKKLNPGEVAVLEYYGIS